MTHRQKYIEAPFWKPQFVIWMPYPDPDDSIDYMTQDDLRENLDRIVRVLTHLGAEAEGDAGPTPDMLRRGFNKLVTPFNFDQYRGVEPAMGAWRGFEQYLVNYGRLIALATDDYPAAIDRYDPQCPARQPWWLGHEPLHQAHRAGLRAHWFKRQANLEAEDVDVDRLVVACINKGVDTASNPYPVTQSDTPSVILHPISDSPVKAMMR